MIKESNFFDHMGSPYKDVPQRPPNISHNHNHGSLPNGFHNSPNINNNYYINQPNMRYELNNNSNLGNLSRLIPNNNIIEDYDPIMSNQVNRKSPAKGKNTNQHQLHINIEESMDRRRSAITTNTNTNANIKKNNLGEGFQQIQQNQQIHELTIKPELSGDDRMISGKSTQTSASVDTAGNKSKNQNQSLWRIYSEKMIIINNDYVLSKVLGKGSFGVVHQGFHKDTYEPVAIKLEDRSAKTRILAKEYQAYIQIYEPDSGMPRILAFGEKDDFQYLVMQMLGPSLEELLKAHTSFSLKTVLMIADQLIERMRFMHNKGFLHRDIKPENFLMGLQESQDTLHVIDLGLAKKWKLPNNQHIKYLTGNKIIGTARYASINSHLGNQLSRRDDMESLGYLLVYLAKGKLPWQSMRSQTKEEKYQQIVQKKQEISVERLCTGLPKEFVQYFRHVKSLAFDEEPCYDYLKGLFLTAFSDKKYNFDFRWDWTS